jgi:hypothetical protein
VVTNQFSRVAVSGRCSFFGNVRLGMDVSLDELRKLYHVVSVVDFGLHTLARVLSQMYPATRGIKVTYGHRHKQQ